MIASQMIDALGVVGSDVAGAFHRMGIAEEELGGYSADGILLALCPTEPLRGLSDDVYRAHCRELIARSKRGQDLAPGTDAECLAVVLRTATIAPLTRAGTAVGEYLFQTIFPGQLPAEARAAEVWKGQIQEDLAKIRQQTSSPERSATKKREAA